MLTAFKIRLRHSNLMCQMECLTYPWDLFYMSIWETVHRTAFRRGGPKDDCKKVLAFILSTGQSQQHQTPSKASLM